MTAENLRELQAFREALVIEHVLAENAADLERVMRTFVRPHYDLRASGRGVIEGDRAVREHEIANFAAFKGIVYVADKFHHTGNDVILEFRVTGRHLGPMLGIAPTGAEVDCPAIAVFEFEGRGLVSERPYCNLALLEAQIRRGGVANAASSGRPK